MGRSFGRKWPSFPALYTPGSSALNSSWTPVRRSQRCLSRQTHEEFLLSFTLADVHSQELQTQPAHYQHLLSVKQLAFFQMVSPWILNKRKHVETKSLKIPSALLLSQITSTNLENQEAGSLGPNVALACDSVLFSEYLPKNQAFHIYLALKSGLCMLWMETMLFGRELRAECWGWEPRGQECTFKQDLSSVQCWLLFLWLVFFKAHSYTLICICILYHIII